MSGLIRVYIVCHCIGILTPPMPDIANFGTKYDLLIKVYTDEGGIK